MKHKWLTEKQTEKAWKVVDRMVDDCMVGAIIVHVINRVINRQDLSVARRNAYAKTLEAMDRFIKESEGKEQGHEAR